MNIKSILGLLLGLIGVIGLLYSIMLYTNGTATGDNIRLLFIYGGIGAVLLASGIGLSESVKRDW